mmetsp:Transcript_29490/g.90242  ORF Transcript_29490/g.90242 Transcript_29490/m.90242 type:complete len:208 (-) Transcript_29490:472-1095(-)
MSISHHADAAALVRLRQVRRPRRRELVALANVVDGFQVVHGWRHEHDPRVAALDDQRHHHELVVFTVLVWVNAVVVERTALLRRRRAVHPGQRVPARVELLHVRQARLAVAAFDFNKGTPDAVGSRLRPDVVDRYCHVVVLQIFIAKNKTDAIVVVRRHVHLRHEVRELLLLQGHAAHERVVALVAPRERRLLKAIAVGGPLAGPLL